MVPFVKSLLALLAVRNTGNYMKNMRSKCCLVRGCVKFTDSTTRCCPKHLARFHSLNYRMRQKYGAEALQPAKTSELSDETLQPEVVYELSIEAHQSVGIYESSDDEDRS